MRLIGRALVGTASALVVGAAFPAPAGADHLTGLPHGVCVTLTITALSPPPTYELCIPLPPVP